MLGRPRKDGSKKIIAIAGALILALAYSLFILPGGTAEAAEISWVEDPSNPVFDPADRAYYPCVLYDQNQFSSHGASYYYKMWFGGYGGGHYEAMTYSDDGVNWSAPVEMQGIDANGYHAKVLYIEGGYGAGPYYYKMWYWAGTMTYSINDLRTADSTDGVNWVNDQVLTQDAGSSLVTGVSPDWNRGSYGPVSMLYNPSASNTGGHPFDYTFTMYYDGTTGGEEVIGLGYSADGNHWYRYSSDPVLDHGGAGDWDEDYVTNGTVIPGVNGEWHMWYSGSGPSGGGNQGIGYATSPDGINWTRDAYNPVMYYTDGVAWRDVRTYTPSVLYSSTGFDGHGGSTLFKMWYTGRTNTPSTNYAVGYAERTNIIPVGPTRKYTAIQSALENAFPGDIIEVDAGTYNEELFIEKAVTVRSVSGAADTIINGPDNRPYVVRIRTSDVTFDGFTVTNPEYTGGSDASGIIVTEDPSISGVHITNNMVHDIGVPNRSPVVYGTTGINLGRCSDTEVDSNEVYNISHGYVDPSKDYWAQAICIWGAGETLLCSDINIHDNYIHDVTSPGSRDSGVGVQGFVSDIVVKDNVLENTGEYGVDTWNDWGGAYSPTIIEGNTISGASTAGVKIVYPEANPITKNTINDCDTGILVTSSGNASTLQCNNLENNASFGINNQSGSELDSRWCWWGDVHGPSYIGISYGDNVSGDLAFRPWLETLCGGGGPPTTPISITTSSPLPQGCVGAEYSTTLAAADGAPPYSWFVYKGTLPPGLTLSPEGVISGTPTARGTYEFSIEAGDGQQADFKEFTLAIGEVTLALEKTAVPSGTIQRGQVITYTLRVWNQGDLAVTGATVSDIVPIYTSYVNHTTTLNGDLVPDVDGNSPLEPGMYISSPGEPEGEIAPGEEAVVTFLVQVGGDLPMGASVRNVAAVEADGVTPIEASYVNDSSAELPSTWYFAEGSTQPGYDEYLLLTNMGGEDINATITYINEAGTEKNSEHLVPANSRRTVVVGAEIPGEASVAAIVQSSRGLMCERSMYFNNNGITGGHDVIGANAPSIDLYLAEGFTGTEGSPFDEWVLILNAGLENAHVQVDYLFPAGETLSREYEVGARSRRSISVDKEVGEGKEVSVHMRSDNPVVAERAMYFVYNNIYPGGHCEKAVTGARTDWYLAEGYTGWEGSPFDEWILVANRNDQPAVVSVTYMFPDGDTHTVDHDAAPNGRLTVYADAEVGQGQMISAHIHSDLPVVVERAMYFDYRNAWPGGHDTNGATNPAADIYFAEGYTGNPSSQFETWLLIQNTSGETKTAQVEYILWVGESVKQDVELPPQSRTTIFANQVLDREATEFSMRVTSKDGSACLLAERAIYFNYTGSFGSCTGGHDVVGY
ncbi:MAG: DUF5719 family protein [Actinomycetota bacterium]|nr:DUF5719 family protein [Actinomycetota bacterium]